MGCHPVFAVLFGYMCPGPFVYSKHLQKFNPNLSQESSGHLWGNMFCNNAKKIGVEYKL